MRHSNVGVIDDGSLDVAANINSNRREVEDLYELLQQIGLMTAVKLNDTQVQTTGDEKGMVNQLAVVHQKSSIATPVKKSMVGTH